MSFPPRKNTRAWQCGGSSKQQGLSSSLLTSNTKCRKDTTNASTATTATSAPTSLMAASNQNNCPPVLSEFLWHQDTSLCLLAKWIPSSSSYSDMGRPAPSAGMSVWHKF
ncbi:hypothetical protein C7M84_004041 [Penaeus vannamei]|uniref:Uncharacterized protein n=1 Tax=Penaeus vannamei TaxID=6689 RepID=A0A423UB14_PENVA|nr:hypothetical protein C7M84_004041 [Penaeus vannamei]